MFKCVGVNCMVKQCSARLVCMDDDQEVSSGCSKMIMQMPNFTHDYLDLDIRSAAMQDDLHGRNFSFYSKPYENSSSKR